MPRPKRRFHYVTSRPLTRKWTWAQMRAVLSYARASWCLRLGLPPVVESPTKNCSLVVNLSCEFPNQWNTRLERCMNDPTFERVTTALLVVDPYNDFISEGGKLWDRVKGVAE